MLPLARYKLLDLSRQMPGPFGSSILADLGMDVLVITRPDDPMQAGLPLLQRNKRNMTLNLKTAEGREILYRLARDADALLEGARPGVTKRLGVDYDTLKEVNPRLVYCSITGFGRDGPYRDRVGHDVNYLGYAGVLHHIRSPGGPPVVPNVQIADIGGGGMMAAIGILAALMACQQTGRGQLVDVSMTDGSFAWAAYPLLLHNLHGRSTGGQSQLAGYYPCYAVYETRDGRHVTVGAFEGHFWANLCRHFDREEFIPRQWDEGPAREEMFAFFRARFRERTMREWVAELADEDICFGPVNTIEEALADPQLCHRGMAVEFDSPLGPVSAAGVPIQLSETPGTIRTPAPAFGEHTDAVLAGLGYTAEEIARLHRDGVV